MKKLFLLLLMPFWGISQLTVADSVPASNVLTEIPSRFTQSLTVEDKLDALEERVSALFLNKYHILQGHDKFYAFSNGLKYPDLESDNIADLVQMAIDTARPIDGLAGIGGVTVDFAKDIYTFDKTVVINSNEQGTFLKTQVILNGNGSTIIQATAGQGGFQVEGGQPTYIRDFAFDMKADTGPAIKLHGEFAQVPLIEQSSMRYGGLRDIVIKSVSENFGLHIVNPLDILVDNINVQNLTGGGIWLENDAENTNYGNSHFGLVRTNCGPDVEDIALKITSTNSKIYNLTTFDNVQISAQANENAGSSSTALYIDGANYLMFNYFKHEYLSEGIVIRKGSNIYFNNTYLHSAPPTSGVDYHNIVVGEGARDIRVLGQVFGANDFTSKGWVLKDSTTTFSQGNFYDLKLAVNVDETKIYEANPQYNRMHWDKLGSNKQGGHVFDHKTYDETGATYNGTFVGDGSGLTGISGVGASDAASITYDNTTSGAAEDNVKAALDYFYANQGGAGTGNVSATNDFGTNNKLIRSDGTGKNVQVANINITGGTGQNLSAPGTVTGASGLITNNGISGATLNLSNLPTDATGLNSGDVWNDGGTLKIVP